MERLLQNVERAIWGWPLLAVLLGTGLYLLVRLRFFPIRMLPHAIKLVFRRKAGENTRVTAFGALCTSLSATIGTGNMVGVATALSLGGPGALFWMEVSAITGLSLKYAEGLLAVAYRNRKPNGGWSGGPSAYITLGLGPKFRLLGKFFSFFGAMAGLFGVGTFVQVGSVTSCLVALISESAKRLHMIQFFTGRSYPAVGILVGLLLSLLSLRLLFGGIERISRFSSRFVPFMCVLYMFCCAWILFRNASQLPAAISSVFAAVKNPSSFGAGLLGSMAAGVSRGIFSNEAGLGTAPIAAASAEGVSPPEQGLISMTAIVFDTVLICTLTGLMILVTGSSGAGVSATMLAFARGLPLPGLAAKLIVFLLLSMFAFTTVIGWSCYGTACLDDLTGGGSVPRKIYLILYGFTVALAPFCSVRGIWAAANICNGLMAVPNVIALVFLSDRIVQMSRSFLDFRKEKRYNRASYYKRRKQDAE
ncbi:MAG: sodium:alanine symporter family protein [Oscillospiraceae bacterium]|nr:sodium:alanine symporter family protein [Oscillospiraceae bacterium]